MKLNNSKLKISWMIILSPLLILTGCFEPKHHAVEGDKKEIKQEATKNQTEENTQEENIDWIPDEVENGKSDFGEPSESEIETYESPNDNVGGSQTEPADDENTPVETPVVTSPNQENTSNPDNTTQPEKNQKPDSEEKPQVVVDDGDQAPDVSTVTNTVTVNNIVFTLVPSNQFKVKTYANSDNTQNLYQIEYRKNSPQNIVVNNGKDVKLGMMDSANQTIETVSSDLLKKYKINGNFDVLTLINNFLLITENALAKDKASLSVTKTKLEELAKQIVQKRQEDLKIEEEKEKQDPKDIATADNQNEDQPTNDDQEYNILLDADKVYKILDKDKKEKKVVGLFEINKIYPALEMTIAAVNVKNLTATNLEEKDNAELLKVSMAEISAQKDSYGITSTFKVLLYGDFALIYEVATATNTLLKSDIEIKTIAYLKRSPEKNKLTSYKLIFKDSEWFVRLANVPNVENSDIYENKIDSIMAHALISYEKLNTEEKYKKDWIIDNHFISIDKSLNDLMKPGQIYGNSASGVASSTISSDANTSSTDEENVSELIETYKINPDSLLKDMQSNPLNKENSAMILQEGEKTLLRFRSTDLSYTDSPTIEFDLTQIKTATTLNLNEEKGKLFDFNIKPFQMSQQVNELVRDYTVVKINDESLYLVESSLINSGKDLNFTRIFKYDKTETDDKTKKTFYKQVFYLTQRKADKSGLIQVPYNDKFNKAMVIIIDQAIKQQKKQTDDQE